MLTNKLKDNPKYMMGNGYDQNEINDKVNTSLHSLLEGIEGVSTYSSSILKKNK
jgi:hypothetical protein